MQANAPRTISAFEVRSLVLFASLVLSGAAGAQSVAAPSTRGTPASTATATATATAASSRATPNAIQAAFARADRNQDGQLSAAEAQSLPMIASRLVELDTDRNGSLSREEFRRGAEQ